jgi:hypothetical protein
MNPSKVLLPIMRNAIPTAEIRGLPGNAAAASRGRGSGVPHASPLSIAAPKRFRSR